MKWPFQWKLNDKQIEMLAEQIRYVNIVMGMAVFLGLLVLYAKINGLVSPPGTQ